MIPSVSIIIATRNYARFLNGTIESVIAQTHRDWELILIDDGSIDNTSEIIEPFLIDSRISYFKTEGLGQSRAKNLGIEKTRSELIAFLDGDDQWLPRKLELQLPLFANKSVGVVYSRRELMDEKGDSLPQPSAKMMRGKIYDGLLIQNTICFSSVVVRREVFEKVGAFDPSIGLAIDYDLWLRVAREFEFDYVDEPLVKYRTGHANLSKRLRERVQTVFGILQRSLIERGAIRDADPKAVGEAWGSTYRSMAYAVRDHEPFHALKCYLNAARFDGRWKESVRNLGSVLLQMLKIRKMTK